MDWNPLNICNECRKSNETSCRLGFVAFPTFVAIFPSRRRRSLCD